ncbi:MULTISPECIES: DUF6234 family protein [unclassified Streptomyces]|uniref:DUF6234 family protein n=1 Tax=unclassified Streptomyces TaxID=2593676 RepID=UPI002ED2D258|nr:DUF6234 family protein [Streptomyces sp. NBC_00891]WSY07261.1 DUF6234 family protein [Streptomyces sp. NBC_00890]WSZ08888.1 DUF6234 family protein [Streptomyces sp. NBC_00869]WSZ23614.1 DUF6234 family protein [Streptomyces sp. NBC_00870]
MPIRSAGPDRPAPSRPGPVATGCLDVMLGLLLIALETVLSTVFFYTYTHSDPLPPNPDMAEAGPPGMDWSGTLVLAVVTAVACLIGVVLLRHGLPIAGVVQLIGACVLLALTLRVWHNAHEDAHATPGAAAPAYAAPPYT